MAIKSFDFAPDDDGSLTLESAVHQAIGAASMCWDFPESAGVFHAEEAQLIALKLIEFFRGGAKVSGVEAGG